jgi:hypothetical protein
MSAAIGQAIQVTSFHGVHGQQTHKIAEYRNAIPEAQLESTNPQGGTCPRRWIVQLNQIRKKKIRNG